MSELECLPEMMLVFEVHEHDGNLAELQIEIVSVCANKSYG